MHMSNEYESSDGGGLRKRGRGEKEREERMEGGRVGKESDGCREGRRMKARKEK